MGLSLSPSILVPRRQPDASAWYPASGYRDSGRDGKFGALTNVGRYGYSWSRSVSGASGFYLDFSAANLNPSGAVGRGYGFQVRCLQE